MGFRQFYYRGPQNVRSEWNLVFAAFSLQKIAVLLRTTRGPATLEQTAAEERTNGQPSELLASTCPFSLSGWKALLQPLGYPSGTAHGYPIGLIAEVRISFNGLVDQIHHTAPARGKHRWGCGIFA